MDVFDRAACVAFSFAILGLALVMKKLTRSWATPACLFSGFWFVFTFVPLCALYFVPVNPWAVAYIFLACLAFSVPAVAGDWEQLQRRNARLAPLRRGYLGSTFVRGTFVASFCISTVFILIDLLVQGITLEQMVFDFFASSNAYLELRYEGDVKVNFYGQWGLIFGYLCVAFGGFVHATTTRPRQRALVLLMTMTPPSLIMLVQAAKGFFFAAIAIILAAHLIHRVLSNQRPHVQLAGLVSYGKYLLLALPLILLSFLSRGLYALDDNEAVIDRLIAYLGAYAFMHLAAFSDWLSYITGQTALMRYDTEPLALGFYTFVALFRLAGSEKEMLPGLYDEYFAYGELAPGNIYTMFRGLITDFGIPGSLIVVFLLGLVFNALYRRMLASTYPLISIAATVTFVQVLYTSYIASMLIYNTTYLVFVLTALLLWANRISFLAPSAHRERRFSKSAAPSASS